MVKKMTPEQRATWQRMLPKKPIATDGLVTKPIQAPVQVDHLPPAEAAVQSGDLTAPDPKGIEKMRQGFEALCSAFSGEITEFPEACSKVNRP